MQEDTENQDGSKELSGDTVTGDHYLERRIILHIFTLIGSHILVTKDTLQDIHQGTSCRKSTIQREEITLRDTKERVKEKDMIRPLFGFLWTISSMNTLQITHTLLQEMGLSMDNEDISDKRGTAISNRTDMAINKT